MPEGLSNLLSLMGASANMGFACTDITTGQKLVRDVSYSNGQLFHISALSTIMIYGIIISSSSLCTHINTCQHNLRLELHFQLSSFPHYAVVLPLYGGELLYTHQQSVCLCIYTSGHVLLGAHSLQSTFFTGNIVYKRRQNATAKKQSVLLLL